MAESRALLLIADIGGYTKYMRLHRLSLAHAQVNTSRLLEAVVDAVPRLDLVEIEGDAAFLSSPHTDADVAPAVETATQAAVAMHRAFHEEQQRLVAGNLCICDGCVQAGELKLKCVAHVGEVALQTIRGRTKPVGVDVILVHRMLKNAVPVPEYVLLSEDLYSGGGAALERANPVEQEFEGLGPTRAYFVDLEEIADALPPPLRTSRSRRLATTMGVVGRGMPYLLGLKKRSGRGAH